jgi:hypothetical protein
MTTAIKPATRNATSGIQLAPEAARNGVVPIPHTANVIGTKDGGTSLVFETRADFGPWATWAKGTTRSATVRLTALLEGARVLDENFPFFFEVQGICGESLYSEEITFIELDALVQMLTKVRGHVIESGMVKVNPLQEY